LIQKKPLHLSGDFQYVLDVLEKTSKSMFITGRAGTGKSTLLQLFRNTTRKKTIVLAPTGVAALNVKGQTIHSFFKLPAKTLNKSDIKRLKYRKIYEKLELLIIDEISMVRADLLDNIDVFLRRNRDNNVPFGGVQVVFFGDLFQLPPVVASMEEKMLFQTEYESPYFFSSHVFQEFEMDMVELSQIYRQDNRQFIRLLESVRNNSMDYDDLEDLNERFEPDFIPDGYYITLSARNATVNKINEAALAKLADKEAYVYLGKTEGHFDSKLFPTEIVLTLKEGAQVMFVKNDTDGKFVNGTIGKVVALTEETIKVEVDEGEKTSIIDVKKMDWEMQRYKLNEAEDSKLEAEVVGKFTQYPLKLAWAITIHKSQGKTFHKMIIDLGKGAFEHGQTYVALSRCSTLSGIVLKQRLRPRDVMVDERVIDFYAQYF